MEKHRSRISICIILLVLLAAVGLAVAQEDTDRNLSKGPFRPALKAQNQAFTVPANDDCPGATVIPDGPYPVASAITADVPEATDAGDPGATCAPTEHGVWYSWTPSATAFYQITTCGSGTTGTPPDNRPDTVMQIISTSDNTCGGVITAVACADDTGGSCDLTSTITASFTAGVTYYIIPYHYLEVGADVGTVRVRIAKVVQHVNDTCGAAVPLVLNQVTIGGVNPLDTNNYQLSGAQLPGCYLNGGQQGSGVCSGGATPGAVCTANANCGAGTCAYSAMSGKDVAFSFTAPDEGDYSFRVTSYDGGTNNTLMVLGNCDAGPSVPSCLRAVNRNVPLAAAPFGAEEVSCLHLTGGQTVFPIVDNTATSTSALSNFKIQVERCTSELEFNGTPAGSEDPAGDGSDPPNSVSRGCPIEGGAFQGIPGGDVDFFTLDAPAAGTRVFAQIDANSAPAVLALSGTNAVGSSGSTTGVNFDMRVTTLTDTLEFDDANNNSQFAGASPNLAGTVLLGGPAYLRITMSTPTAFAEPYRLFTTLRAPGSGPLGTSAAEEPGPDDDTAFPVGDYFYGHVDDREAFCAGHPEIVCTADDQCPDAGSGETCDDTFDTDFYGFCARAGEQILVSVDADPARDATPLYTGLFLFLPSGGQLYGIADLAAQGTTSSIVPSPGTLTGTTPFSPSQAINYLATETGLYAVAINGQDATGAGQLSSGDYLASFSTQCTAQESDLSITKTGDANAVAGGNVNYHITVHNAGPAMGTAAFFHDTTPAGTTFVSISIPDGWDCVTPPVGTTGDIDCFELSGCFDGDAAFDITLNVPLCAGNGNITNTVEVAGATADPDSSNNTGTVITAVSDPGTCDDGDSCTENDHCDNGACVGDTISCDDSNDCTSDACVDGTCQYTNITGPCDDGNACTTGDTCSDGACQPGTPNNDPCDDGNSCTSNDTCNNGVCTGDAGAACDDGNVCTDDSCDAVLGCVHTCNNTCNTKGQGYWKRLCHGPHSGDFYTQADVDCVNNSCTFSGVETISDLCDELNPQPGQANDKCQKAEAKFMSLLLNSCRCRVQDGQSLDSRCGPGTTVGDAIAASDATLCNPGRTDADCNHADCATFEIINGEAMWANSLRLTKSGTSVRLNWDPPYANPDSLTPGGPKKYHVYRREAGSTGLYTQIGIVMPNQALTFLDTTAGSGSWTYEVTSEY